MRLLGKTLETDDRFSLHPSGQGCQRQIAIETLAIPIAYMAKNDRDLARVCPRIHSGWDRGDEATPDLVGHADAHLETIAQNGSQLPHLTRHP